MAVCSIMLCGNHNYSPLYSIQPCLSALTINVINWYTHTVGFRYKEDLYWWGTLYYLAHNFLDTSTVCIWLHHYLLGTCKSIFSLHNPVKSIIYVIPCNHIHNGKQSATLHWCGEYLRCSPMLTPYTTTHCTGLGCCHFLLYAHA